MNYLHGFHAGNHADVLKHAALMALLAYMKAKAKPLFVLDTHSGRGAYDLAAAEAQRSGEYRQGIARLIDAPDAPAALAPYLEPIRAANPAGGLTTYPGSPVMIARSLRVQDRLVACDLHPGEASHLKEALHIWPRARVETRDGYGALKALLPPPERRGLVLIDPPFERKTEFADLAAALAEAWKRFPVGVYLVWYPLKDRVAADGLLNAVVQAGMRDATTYELFVRDPEIAPGMAGSGLLALNASFALDRQMAKVGPWLAARLAQGPGASFRQARLTPE